MRRVVIPDARRVRPRRASGSPTCAGWRPTTASTSAISTTASIRIAELVDSYRDLLSGATDMYLSTVANRQGEVNKQLTIIATIFLPLTFLTGFFGQNFAFLTNHVLNTELSFSLFGLGLLFVSILGFIVFFRRKHWM